MTQTFVGQIVITGFGFPQKNFAGCNGQLMSIAQNQALFSLFGTAYGGDGIVTFGLPDLRSRTPTGGFPSQDPGWNWPEMQLGQIGGDENVTLTLPQLPAHIHGVTMTTAVGARGTPRGAMTLGTAAPDTSLFYGAPAELVPLGGGPLGPTGGGAPHPNIQPYETINFNIAIAGVFPSRN